MSVTDHTETRLTPSVVIVGYGWAGSVIAAELARAGHAVTVLEQGGGSLAAPCGHIHDPGDERPSLAQARSTRDETYTLRHHHNEPALPLRRFGSFLVGEGVGGSGVLWGGLSPRFTPASLSAWPVSFADLEGLYARAERIIGVRGRSGANPREGRRSGPFPVEIEVDSEVASEADREADAPVDVEQSRPGFAAAARHLGWSPYPLPVADLDREYVNSYGVRREPCQVFGTTASTPRNTTVPAAAETGLVTVITGARVTRVIHNGKHATGVRYIRDSEERDITADIVVLSSWIFANVRLLLLSGIDEPYDPRTTRGVVGRNLTTHSSVGVTAFYARGKAPAFDQSWALSEFDTASDRPREGFAGGAQIATHPARLGGAFPFGVAPRAAGRWGPDWKAALHAYAASTVRVGILGEARPSAQHHLDLDPVYTDHRGDPLLRVTFDWTDEDRALADVVGAEVASLLESTGAQHVDRAQLPDHYDSVQYQNSHFAGGAVMGDDPATSVVDSELRSWRLPNLWVVGSSAFPTDPAPNPTLTVVAFALRAADAIRATLPSLAALAAH